MRLTRMATVLLVLHQSNSAIVSSIGLQPS